VGRHQVVDRRYLDPLVKADSVEQAADAPEAVDPDADSHDRAPDGSWCGRPTVGPRVRADQGRYRASWCRTAPPTMVATARPRTAQPSNGVLRLGPVSSVARMVHVRSGSITVTSAMPPTRSVPSPSSLHRRAGSTVIISIMRNQPITPGS